MKLNTYNYKLTEEEFNSLSTLDKRTYIIQTEQEETNWWVRTMAKIYVYGFFIGIFVIFIIMMSATSHSRY